MEDIRRHQIIDTVQELWHTERLSEAGELLFERIPMKHWAAWGADILGLVQSLVPPSSEIEAVLELAKRPDSDNPENEDEWRAAHEIVDAVNNLHYELTEPLAKSVFTLAKDIAKVVYNSRRYPAWFDYDAGWNIASDLKQVTELVHDSEFTKEALLALCSTQYIDPDENRTWSKLFRRNVLSL